MYRHQAHTHKIGLTTLQPLTQAHHAIHLVVHCPAAIAVGFLKITLDFHTKPFRIQTRVLLLALLVPTRITFNFGFTFLRMR
jgi:hypothetical protein